MEKIEAVSSKIDAFLSAQEKREKDAADAAADRARDEAFNRLQSAGYTEDGLGAIKKLMMERNIADPEAASALFDRMNPKPVEGSSSWEPPNWDIRTNAVDHDLDGLFKDPDRWADARIYDVLAAERSQGNNG